MIRQDYLFMVLVSSSFAQDNPIALKGALIYPVVGALIQTGVVIIQKGRY